MGTGEAGARAPHLHRHAAGTGGARTRKGVLASWQRRDLGRARGAAARACGAVRAAGGVVRSAYRGDPAGIRVHPAPRELRRRRTDGALALPHARPGEPSRRLSPSRAGGEVPPQGVLRRARRRRVRRVRARALRRGGAAQRGAGAVEAQFQPRARALPPCHLERGGGGLAGGRRAGMVRAAGDAGGCLRLAPPPPRGGGGRAARRPHRRRSRAGRHGGDRDRARVRRLPPRRWHGGW